MEHFFMQPDTYDDSLDDEGYREPRIRPRKHQKSKPKHSQHEDMAEHVADTVDGKQLSTTYRPTRHEAQWLLSSLGSFFSEQLITDVLAQVKGGKEATVYCCQAHPSTGLDLVAAKVYRPKQFRSLSNDAMYREGRSMLNAQGRSMMNERGHQAQRPDHRMMKAVRSKSAFGQEVMHSSWLSYEYSFMEQMHRLGAPVPKPIACADNAILMSYYGELGNPAPLLMGVQLTKKEAKLLFEQTIQAIHLMLSEGYIHGDLSAYNILYWQGAIAIIDFPQVSSLAGNSNAHMILQRDITRVCDYFRQYGVRRDAVALTQELWEQYMG
jgi:RIO kinase 1